jgi:hypothetical protein
VKRAFALVLLAVNPFVDPGGYRRFIDRSEQPYVKQLEQGQGP